MMMNDKQIFEKKIVVFDYYFMAQRAHSFNTRMEFNIRRYIYMMKW